MSAINDADAAVVLWRTPGHTVQSTVRTNRTGVWRTLAVPSGAAARGGDGFVSPTAAMNAKGQATVAWVAHEQHGWAVRSAFRSGTNAIWRATPALFRPHRSVRVWSISIAGNAEGDAIAAWSAGRTDPSRARSTWPCGPPTRRGVPQRRSHVPRRRRRARHPCRSPSPPTDASRFAGASTGTNPATSQVTVATGSALTGVWTAHAIAAGVAPRVAVNSAGALAAVWARLGRPSPTSPDVAVAANGTTWTTPQTLEHTCTGSESDFGSVALAESGRAFAYWSVHLGPGEHGSSRVGGGRRRVDGILQEPASRPHAGAQPPGRRPRAHGRLRPPVPWTIANSYDAAPRPVVTHAQWVWLRNVFIPAHYAPALRATMWTRLTSNPSAAAALVHRSGPASIR